MTIAVACKFTGVSRSGYYKYMKRKDKPTQKRGRPTSGEVDEAMAKVIRWVKDCWAPVQVGYRRITAIITHYLGITVNKKKVQRINQIKGWQAQSFRRPTRNSYDPEDPNRPVTDPKDTIEEIEPNSCWSTDLTKIHVENVGWANFIPVIDNATRECLGWIFSRRGRAVEAKDAIREAVINRFGSESDVPDDLELLSDNGSTFLAHDFADQMNEYGIKQKYTPFRCPSANGMAERFMRTMKEEKVWHHEFETMDEAERVIAEWVKHYNQTRRHSSLDYRSPASFHEFLEKKAA